MTKSLSEPRINIKSINIKFAQYQRIQYLLGPIDIRRRAPTASQPFKVDEWACFIRCTRCWRIYRNTSWWYAWMKKTNNSSTCRLSGDREVIKLPNQNQSDPLGVVTLQPISDAQRNNSNSSRIKWFRKSVHTLVHQELQAILHITTANVQRNS